MENKSVSQLEEVTTFRYALVCDEHKNLKIAQVENNLQPAEVQLASEQDIINMFTTAQNEQP